MSKFDNQTKTSPSKRTAIGLLGRLWRRAVDMYRVHEERQALYRLDARDLRDIRATRVDAEREARRRFWDVPETSVRVGTGADAGSVCDESSGGIRRQARSRWIPAVLTSKPQTDGQL